MTIITGRRQPAAGSPPGSVPAPAGGAVLGIRLLGRFAVERDGQEIAPGAFGGRQARRLLRLLALRRGSLVAKDLIADALWPEDPPADPAGNVEILISRIRRAVGDRALIRTGAAGYVLSDDDRCWVDAEAFLAAVQAGRAALGARPARALTAFRAAIGLWRGEPLPEDAYADWAQADRRHLLMSYLEALDGATTAALDSASGGGGSGGARGAAAAEAAGWARHAVAAEPLRECSVLLLVRALAAAGDQAGALTVFDEYRDRIAVETGLRPTPRAQEVRESILAGPAASRPPEQGKARPAPNRDLFLGREEECAAIAQAAAGAGRRVVLVTGPSGIGKSALLEEAARRTDVPVLRAQAFSPDQNEAWSLAGRLLSQVARILQAPATTVLPEKEASALAEVVPGLAAPSGAALDEESRRAFALRGAVRLVAATARPRCLIMADDLQWADPTSLTLLGLLLRRLEGVSLAAAYRPDGGNPEFDPAEALGVPDTQLTRITLGPLPAGVIKGMFGDQLLAEAIIRQAGRTPFTITEVIAALSRQGAITRDGDRKWRLRPGQDAAGAARIVAAGIAQAAGNRLTGLPSRWRDTLGLLALLGRPAPAALLAAATGADLRSVLDILEGLGSAGLASLGPQGWAPCHELVRRAVTTTMCPADTARSHALLAMALRQHVADPAEAASHLAASGDAEGAAMAYAAAARRQLDRICDREAARLADTGLRLNSPGEARAALLEVRGEAHRRGGELTAARADFSAALDSHGDCAARSRMLSLLAILDARTADAARGSELAGLAIAEAGGQPAALGQALAAAAIIDLTEGNLARARYRVRRAARLLDGACDSGGSARLLYWRAMACFIGGSLRDAVLELDRLARLPVALSEILRLWSPRATRGHALVFLGQAADGLTEIEETLTWARAAHHPAVEAECLWRRAEALTALGQATGAIEAAKHAADIATRIGHAEWTAAAHRGHGIACEAAGLPGQAESAYRRSLAAAGGNLLFRAWAAARLGACLARQGRPGEAAPHVRAALAAGTPLTDYEARWAHAELLASQHDDAACRASAAAALRRTRDGGYLILLPRLRELAGL